MDYSISLTLIQIMPTTCLLYSQNHLWDVPLVFQLEMQEQALSPIALTATSYMLHFAFPQVSLQDVPKRSGNCYLPSSWTGPIILDILLWTACR